MTDIAWNPFGELTDTQRNQLDAYAALLRRFNRKINLISPDTADDIHALHLRHCLALTYNAFPRGSTIVDWGTGGGLPAIPLAIACPDVTVYAVDSVGKKVRAVRTMARRLGIENLFAWEGRAEQWTGRAHYSVSRATAPLVDLWRWHTRVVDADVPGSPHDRDDMWTPGLICLKGGDLSGEIAGLHAEFSGVRVEQRALAPLLGDDTLYADKGIVSVHDDG